MKALIYTETGATDVLKILEVPVPEIGRNQVLISVKACSLTLADYGRFEKQNGKIPRSVRVMNVFLGYKGKPLGAEVAGVVKKVGQDVYHVKIGDEVFGKTAGTSPTGGIAEFAVMDKNRVFQKPLNFSFAEASTVSISFETALGAIRKAKVGQGNDVMIYGSSGGVGLFAVQIAKSMGATVTGVCSTRNVEIAKNYGCDEVVDYKREDFTKTQKKFDVILGINGCNSMKSYEKLLKENGIFVGVGNVKQGFKALFKSISSNKFTYLVGLFSAQKGYLQYARKMAEAGELRVHIDNVYAVQDTAKAIDTILEKHAQGKTVIQVNF